METVTITVADRAAVRKRVADAFKGKKQGAQISFESIEVLFEVMTPKRWQIVKAMLGAGPLSIREVARRVGRDVHGVHTDVVALINSGVVRKTEDGMVVFPFSKMRLDATVAASAAGANSEAAE